MKTKAKVVARYTNRNSFGLRSHVIVFDTGVAVRALRSGSFHDSEEYAAGNLLDFGFAIGDACEIVNTLRFANFECVEELSPAPSADVIHELFSIY